MRISSEGVRIAMYGAMLEKVAPSDENWELGNWSDCRHVPDNMRGCNSRGWRASTSSWKRSCARPGVV